MRRIGVICYAHASTVHILFVLDVVACLLFETFSFLLLV